MNLPSSVFRANEVSCYADALSRVGAFYGGLHLAPPGALQHLGGLLPVTARAIESVIAELVAQGQRVPTTALVMAEIDRRIDYAAVPKGPSVLEPLPSGQRGPAT